MTRTVTLGLSVALALGMFCGAKAQAQPVHARPGSLLIFPLFNSTDGNNTLITVTNTNQDERTCGNGLRQGDVTLHYVYTDGPTWLESDRNEDLTPADTITVFARGHNPNQEVGFLVVEARDPESRLPIDFDHLIGSAIVVNSEFDFEWSYTPYAFEGLPEGEIDRENGAADRCGRPFTDEPSSGHFNTIDFDGEEYSSFPECLYLDQFFGEGTPERLPNVSFSNTLYLMSTQRNETDVNLLGWNNNESRFSRTFSFECWLQTTLGDLTNAVTQENLADDSDPNELRRVSTGWLQLKTDTPGSALLGVFVQRSDIGQESFVAGRELQFEGSRVVSLPRAF